MTGATKLTMTGLEVGVVGGDTIVTGIDMAVRSGEVLALVGESGSGKSTLALACLGFARPGTRIVGGSIVIDGEDVLTVRGRQLRQLRGTSVAYVPQDPSTALNPSHRIGAAVGEMLEVHEPSISRRARDERVLSLLTRVGLPGDREFARRYPHQVSGGQQQRVTIAMALACSPAGIVLDEPTTGLDVRTQARILELIRELPHTTGAGVLYITHDLLCVAEVADAVAVMYSGEIVEIGSRDQVLYEPAHPYTRSLLRAVPATDRGRVSLRGIDGTAHGPATAGDACRFMSRCPVSEPACGSAHPALRAREAGHEARCIRMEQLGRFERPSPAGAGDEPRWGDVVLAVEGLRVSHRRGRRKAAAAPLAVTDASLILHDGETLALAGESGSGKTTIARSIAGLHEPLAGTITLDDVPMARGVRRRTAGQRRAIQLVHQNPDSYLNPRHTIERTITRPLEVFFGRSRREARREAASMLEQVRLPVALLRRFPAELSGGEKQRVAIARALAARPKVLICDEVTSALDVSIQASILNLLADLKAEWGLSILFISHDMGVIRSIADRVILLRAGEIVEESPAAHLFDRPASAYGRELLDAVPRLEPRPADPRADTAECGPAERNRR